MGLFGKTASVSYTVPTMNCGHCEAKVKERVEKMHGVKKVQADSGSKSLKISYTGEAPSVEQVNQALSDTDYRAEA
ncbi:MAG: heavy-metal-associated domain-containing protein [Spirochaeta sp.]